MSKGRSIRFGPRGRCGRVLVRRRNGTSGVFLHRTRTIDSANTPYGNAYHGTIAPSLTEPTERQRTVRLIRVRDDRVRSGAKAASHLAI